ncbi:hypothetical protein MVLG_02104 [Microbotryum lychnidis-dioicae p1A1 Lamole]|uniref:Uncharacterized protein n=1 Tax=Microbotryum lychnidis-dioicae (strain p1A1 Lamole / MvSl-1064) TaxID=683840 RepID=U5H456_USTV1|nr:hypothetical protein MVLG_02104 [Microbotryum lychnidis-dioicae p1A1 Lamole]|eukprot:KDE07641.1 hypothetical protein MVLG_02104 [Microbotryum lychnidis-dioicae p1A1 Lamole]
MTIKKDTPPSGPPSSVATTDLIPPPPTYEEASSVASASGSSRSSGITGPQGQAVLIPIPSPTSTRQPLLPISHSQPSALQIADRRARRRFLLALLNAIAIWAIVGAICGSSVAVAVGDNPEHAHRDRDVGTGPVREPGGRHDQHRHRTDREA